MSNFYARQYEHKLLMSSGDIEALVKQMTDEDAAGLILEILGDRPKVEDIVKKRITE